MAIAPSVLGSPTSTGWKRRSSAASFSMCLRYSSSVVAPTARSSPRASMGLSRLAASTAPSAAPAPTMVCSSSMNRITRPSASATSLSTALSRSSNSPRYFAPATSAPMSRAITRRSRSDSGTSPETMRWASPSAMAVLPTPGSPMSTGLFFVRRERTWITRRISSSRPITGSSLPASRGLREVAAELLEGLVLVLRALVGHAMRAAHGGHGLGELLPGGSHVHARVGGEGEQEVLGGDVLVAERARLLLGAPEDLPGGGVGGGLLGGAPDGGKLVEGVGGGAPHGHGVGAGALEDGRDDALGLLEQHGEDVVGGDLRVAARGRQPLGGGERLLGLGGQSVGSHR